MKEQTVMPCKRVQQGIPVNGGYHVFQRGYLRGTYVHRYIYEQEHGKLKAGEVVRHLCNNAWCVELTHLIAGTKQEDIHDQMRSGTFAKRKLSLEQVKEIRLKYRTPNKTQQQLANEYRVHNSTINRIVTKETWKNDY